MWRRIFGERKRGGRNLFDLGVHGYLELRIVKNEDIEEVAVTDVSAKIRNCQEVQLNNLKGMVEGRITHII